MTVIEVEDSLHKEYKKLCKKMGKIMKMQTNRLIAEFIEKHRNNKVK